MQWPARPIAIRCRQSQRRVFSDQIPQNVPLAFQEVLQCVNTELPQERLSDLHFNPPNIFTDAARELEQPSLMALLLDFGD